MDLSVCLEYARRRVLDVGPDSIPRCHTPSRRSRCATVLTMGTVAAVLACNPAAKPRAADSSSATAGPPSATISLADLAGTWRVRSVAETGDSTLVTYELIATPDPSGWRFKVADRTPVPVRVTTGGDSIMTEAGPYESVLRKGVQVTLRGVLRRQGDKLIGTTVAHFSGGGADSVLRVRTEATRTP